MPLLAGGGGGLGLPRFSTKLGGRSGAACRPHPPLPLGTTSWPPAGDTACALAAAVMIPYIVSARPRFLKVIVAPTARFCPPLQTDPRATNSRLDTPRGLVKQGPGENGRRGRGQ